MDATLARELNHPEARAILSVGPEADADEIKRAYKAACVRWHPDKNLDDPEAEAKFKAVQTAFRELTVNRASGAALDRADEFMSHLDDDDAAAATAAATHSAAGRPKLRIGDGVLYIGEVAGGQPHGRGDLILKDGTVHRGSFDAGRATGAGLLFSANGTVFRGAWAGNKKVGPFEVVDPKGGRWHDLYDEGGVRQRRTQALLKAMAAAEEAVADAAAAAARARLDAARVAAAAAAVAEAQAADFAPPPFELTPEQRRETAERRRLAGAAARVEQRRIDEGEEKQRRQAAAGTASPGGGGARAVLPVARAPLETSLFVGPPLGAALGCRHCAVRFHAAYRSHAPCRQHWSDWLELPEPCDYAEWPEGGMWRCCSAKSLAYEGCAVGCHEEEPEPPHTPGADDAP